MNPTTQQSNDRDFMEALDRIIPVQSIVETLRNGMYATKILKNGVIVPDWGARFEAVKLILAYKIGLPIARKEIVVVQESNGNDEGLIERMARIPSLLATIKNLVARAEARKLAIDAEVVQGRPFLRIPASDSSN